MDVMISNAPVPRRAFANERPTTPAAPSSPEDKSISQRQRQALLPSVLEPAGSAVEARQQEVAEKDGQKESRRVDEIRQAAEKANQYFKQAETHLKFIVSEQTGRVVIHVVDSISDEIVRAIPPEKMERFAETTSTMRGLLFETKG